MNEFDLLIVGGGVLGTFHAYHALEKGLKVAILEKDKLPQSATVRNFGMVVPSGMDTKWQSYGRESLSIYKEISKKVDLTMREYGNIYIASNPEELVLIEELHQINLANGYTSLLLSKEECLAKYPGLRSDYVLAGLYFPEEVLVEPREMIYRLQDFLVKEKGLHLLNYQQVNHCEVVNDRVEVTTSAGAVFKAEQAIICNGSDFQTLFPDVFAKSEIEVVKLQMMQTAKQPSNFVLPSGVLTGNSIRRYEAFEECPSFAAIKAKEDPQSLTKKWGINILFKQAMDGSVIIGDSHEYANVANANDLGFDNKEEINQFMIDEAKKVIDLPNFEIEKRWIGIYSQVKNHDIFEHTIDERIHIITGIGGKGMTVSAGFAKEKIAKLL